MDRITERILFIGAGNMARALIGGAVESGAVDTAEVAVVDPNPAQRAQFDTAFASAVEGVRWLGECTGGAVVLAVKPQMLHEAVLPVREAFDVIGGSPLVVSILAGIRAQEIHEAFAGRARVVRVMPNTPAAISMGMSAIASGPGTTAEDLQLAERLFGSVGETVAIDESMMDAFTGLAGSGPAYVFYLAEAMIRAAVEMGFTNEQAQRITKQTIAGSGGLLAQSGEDPASLRAKVTSKNGTTAAGTLALDEAGVMEAITRAVIAARDRGVELGRG